MWKRIIDRIRKITLFRSLQFRIFILLVLVSIVPATIMHVAILDNYEEQAITVRTSEVSNQFKIIANHLITYNYLQDASSDVINAELEQLSTLYDGRVLIISSNFKVIKDTYGISEGKTIISEDIIKCFQGENTVRYDAEDGFIEMTIPIGDMVATEDGDSRLLSIRGVMLTSVATDTVELTKDILSRKALTLEVIICMLIVGAGFGISRILITPFNKVTKAISEVKGGYTDEALAVPDYLETEHIVEAFNQVLRRMRTLDQSRQEFVSNVSHELKTPLTSMKVLADSLIAQENAPVELYQEFMSDIAEEIERENKIINDLLALVKLDKTSSELNVSAVDINGLVELVMKRLRPIARKQNVDVVLESNRQITAEVDDVKLTLAFSNLVENAIKYNRPQGWVKVLLDADHQFFTVTVEDSGVGIPEEAHEKIYERFYRVDKSHSREIGGTGLGLAIVRNVVLMHRGSIQVTSVEGEGTVFVVKIPISYSK